jgi:C4-dicarboxylate-specific signal transduction histidine kinase
MPKKEKDDIYAKWINVGLIEGISPKVFYSVVAVLAVILLVILVVIVFNKMLREKVNQKTLALNAELKERKRIEKELAYLNNTLEQKVEMRTCELKNAIDNLKAVQGELVESEKMVSLGKITLTMAHRLNTPIGSAITINSFNRDLTGKLEKLTVDHQLLGLIKDIKKSNEMIASELNNVKRYIDQMKKVSDFKAEGPKQDIKLLGYLMLLLNSYEGILKEHHIEVNLNCEETVSLYASSNSLDCIFNNLIDNSLRHAFVDRDKGRIDIDIIEEDDSVEISYADDGIGLSEELISDIFSPMVTRNMGQNNGFGLNILYNIVKFELNGSLDVKSMSSQGVTFKIKVQKNNASS